MTPSSIISIFLDEMGVFLLFQAFEKLNQTGALAGAWSTMHIEVAVGVVDGEEGDAFHVECFNNSAVLKRCHYHVVVQLPSMAANA